MSEYLAYTHSIQIFNKYNKYKFKKVLLIIQVQDIR